VLKDGKKEGNEKKIMTYRDFCLAYTSIVPDMEAQGQLTCPEVNWKHKKKL
jgi:hypothetical protein